MRRLVNSCAWETVDALFPLRGVRRKNQRTLVRKASHSNSLMLDCMLRDHRERVKNIKQPKMNDLEVVNVQFSSVDQKIQTYWTAGDSEESHENLPDNSPPQTAFAHGRY